MFCSRFVLIEVELLDRSLESVYVACLYVVLDLVCMCYCVVVFVVSPFELSSFVCILKKLMFMVDLDVRGQ
jgi:hypothetical protein